jgi:hypothetical protein
VATLRVEGIVGEEEGVVSGKFVRRREDTMFLSTGSDCIGVSEVISICFLDLLSKTVGKGFTDCGIDGCSC